MQPNLLWTRVICLLNAWGLQSFWRLYTANLNTMLNLLCHLLSKLNCAVPPVTFQVPALFWGSWDCISQPSLNHPGLDGDSVPAWVPWPKPHPFAFLPGLLLVVQQQSTSNSACSAFVFLVETHTHTHSYMLHNIHTQHQHNTQLHTLVSGSGKWKHDFLPLSWMGGVEI